MVKGCEKERSNSSVYETNMYNKNSHPKSHAFKPNITDNHLIGEKNEDRMEKCSRKPSMASSSVKLYRRRFLMLFIFAICSMMNGVPQFQYTVVADIVACYYDVSLTNVNWTSVVFMVAFLPLVFPVMFLMGKKGLRITLLIGGLLNFTASVIQCFSFSPERYAVIMTSQTIYAMGQVFVLSLPPFIAGVWFGANEVGLACALGVFGNQLGIALGFIIPPLTMTNDCTDEVDITYELSVISYPLAAINTVILAIIYLFFQEKPPMFPSVAQANKSQDDINYVESLKNLFKDLPFVLLLVSYGLITGTYFAMSTIMNEMVLIHFPGEEIDAGWMGALMVFAGMIGSVLLGAILDKTHKFKEISLICFGLSFLLLVSYTGVIQIDNFIWVQFLFFTLLGFIMTGYLPVGFDFGAEITYPVPEAISGSLLNASTQLFSIILTVIASSLLQTYGDLVSNIFLCANILLGFLITVCIKCELKRANADGGKPA